jgi:hypothetical protein
MPKHPLAPNATSTVRRREFSSTGLTPTRLQILRSSLLSAKERDSPCVVKVPPSRELACVLAPRPHRLVLVPSAPRRYSGL